jgi:outer membrane protein
MKEQIQSSVAATRKVLSLAIVAALAVAGWNSIAAQEAGSGAVASGMGLAVIDVQRLLTESIAGKEALEELRALRDQRQAEMQEKQREITDFRSRIAEGRLSLSTEKLQELEKTLEERVITFGRFQDDADRELQKKRDEAFGEIEQQIMPIIVKSGAEMGFTAIFNKFQSGLLFAQESIDVTDEVLRRYDATANKEGS